MSKPHMRISFALILGQLAVISDSAIPVDTMFRREDCVRADITWPVAKKSLVRHEREMRLSEPSNVANGLGRNLRGGGASDASRGSPSTSPDSTSKRATTDAMKL